MSQPVKANSRFEQMTGAPVEKLVCRLAAPTIAIMMISSMYNMADTYFVAPWGPAPPGRWG
jgi:Na+-driven multidrug efflux pump